MTPSRFLFLSVYRSKSVNPKYVIVFIVQNPFTFFLESLQELDEMKKRLKEMEEEAAALREMQAKVEKEMGAVQGPYLTSLHLNFA